MVRVARVRPLEGYRLRVGFTDGTERVVDVDRKGLERTAAMLGRGGPDVTRST